MYLLHYLADIIVGFEHSEYTILEGDIGSVVSIIRDQLDASFSVEVTAGMEYMYIQLLMRTQPGERSKPTRDFFCVCVQARRKHNFIGSAVCVCAAPLGAMHFCAKR